MERREAPGLPRKRPARHGTPTTLQHLGPGSSAGRPADRKAGLREPIARLPGRLPALHPSPMEREGKQGDGRTWASEKTKTRDSGALATGMIPKSVKRFSEKIMPQLGNV